MFLRNYIKFIKQDLKIGVMNLDTFNFVKIC